MIRRRGSSTASFAASPSVILRAHRRWTDDAIWWLNGDPTRFAGAGTSSKAWIGAVWDGLFGVLDGGLHMVPERMLSENGRVAAQIRSDARTTSGKHYRNGFLMTFTLQGEKIASVREYTDLMHTAAVFG